MRRGNRWNMKKERSKWNREMGWRARRKGRGGGQKKWNETKERMRDKREGKRE